MTVRALVGLAGFNVFLLGVGGAWLWALRGWGPWGQIARDAGLAYMVGVALLGITLSIELVFGVPFTFATVVLTGVALVLVAAVLRGPLVSWRPAPTAAPTRGMAMVSAVFGLMIVVYLQALFRASRLSPLSAWDAWAFWVPKAKAIYFYGALDEQLFRELANPTYPPLVPAMEASAFLFMGAADVVTLHVQFWFFTCGFVAAVAGLLAPRIQPLLLWPFLLLVLVAPRVVGRTLDPQADFLLDYFFALAAVLVVLWLLEREPWLLATASTFLAGALLTKREGMLLVASIVVAALVASWHQRRFAWPRLALAAIAAAAVSVPWRMWFSSRELEGELPSAGVLALFDNLERTWPALEATTSIVFDYDLWLVIAPLAIVAVALAYLGGARVLPTYSIMLYGLVFTSLTWVLWSFIEIELPFVQDEGVNPIVRFSGSIIVASAALVPLLLEAAWQGRDSGGPESP